ncbi:hypothetical protein Kpol_344p4 [Vanderwaltozyma polyspora DSM 70294]|uniref:C2H2-type domain-containing protein n=1 Tax=Vanderwaltozyma polyspora (strain ATCC 22028 / DSM 70294 / BCRC 21397 / CBS 2163 / NBRC 10782 / NRRL Y-8283 / UCD 57-17) TaxID=436907 RepID=A7TSS0_VANPO|nr:uncharacterized protein Kpol_344p4 [Vanderwaltozyma polyspora DSM 70294]EDO14684.1 hypothetical protein Kpol_344p4 [Vanderwaltozyma polyspora DSM 70294]
MDSERWNINPSDILKNVDNRNKLYDGENHFNKQLEYSAIDDISNKNDGFDYGLDLNYDEMDKLLTQELNGLDIPMIPDTDENKSNKKDNFGLGDFDWNQLQLNFGTVNIETGSNSNDLITNNKHKRGQSGTAIFGFANHNKTLSISSIKKNYTPRNDINENEYPKDFNELEYSYPASKNNGSNDEESTQLGKTLLKQQEELRMALEKQKEMNMKLEQQLLENRLQQEHLQNALLKQEVVTNQLVTETKVSTPFKNTPSPQKMSPQRHDIIITSNSKSGSYQFPPQSMISPPMSNASFNGSPSRKSKYKPSENGSGNHFLSEHNNLLNSGYHQDYLKPPINTISLNTPNLLTNSGKGYYGSSRFSSPSHRKKDSTISTVSTILQHHDDDVSDSDYHETVGLGIQLMSGNKPKDSKSVISNSLQVDKMPTIPGSTSNTPIGKNIFPQKQTFHHTPTKANIDLKNDRSDNIFNDSSSVSYLNPPILSLNNERTPNRRNSDHSIEFPEPDSSYYGNIPRPENHFKFVETPSPVLKFFDDKSPQHESNDNQNSQNSSPTKITRKLTTLPRGTIDIYVKELSERAYECLYPNCHKIFKRRYNIRSHIQTHLKDRPYICDFQECNKSFVRNHDLVRHKKSHSKRKLICVCGKKFNKEETYLAHKSKKNCNGQYKQDKAIVKKSPVKGPGSVNSSPVRDSIKKDSTGYVTYKMEEQLRNEMTKHGLLQLPHNMAMNGPHIMLSPSLSSGASDLGSPLGGRLELS